MTLYVDCDDTLVLWDTPTVSGHGTRWQPNTPLVAAIRRWRDANPDEPLVIWSGGGADYADLWHRRILPDVMAGAIDKGFPEQALVLPGDTCVDDVTIKVAGRLLLPQEFIAEWGGDAP